MSRCRAVTLSIVMWLGAQSALAQSTEVAAGATDLENLNLEDLLQLKVATGSFLDLDLEKSPYAMTVITRDQIKMSNARNMGELLEMYVPGFQQQVNHWNGYIWGMRGITSDRNTKFIYAINGLKTNSVARDGAAFELSLGLMDDIERIEVIRGPSGLTFGTGAIAGVVNVVTKQLGGTGANIAISGSTWGLKQVEGSARVELPDETKVTLSVGARAATGMNGGRVYGQSGFPYLYDVNSDNFAPLPSTFGPGGSLPSQFAFRTPLDLRASFDIQWKKLRVYGRYTTFASTASQWFPKDAYPGIQGPPTSPQPDSFYDGRNITWDSREASIEPYGSELSIYRQSAVYLDAKYSFDIGTKDALNLEAAFIGGSRDYSLDGLPGYQVPTNPNPAGRSTDAYGERRFNGIVQYLLRRFDNIESAAGLQFNYDYTGYGFSGENYTNGSQLHPNIGTAHYIDIALYDETMWQVLPWMNLLGGIRYDKYTPAPGIVSYRGAVVFTPNRNHTIKLSVTGAQNYADADTYQVNGRQFYDDNGVFYDRPFVLDPNDSRTPVIPGAPTEATLKSIRPESITNFEISSVNKIGPVTIMPAVSYAQIRNLFGYLLDENRIANIGPYDALTAEIDIRYSPTPSLAIGLNHAWQRPLNADLTTSTITRPAVSVVPTDDGHYTVAISDTETETLTLEGVKQTVTGNGRNYLNLASHTTKLFVTWNPLSWLSFSSTLRILWTPFAGRAELIAGPVSRGFSYLSLDRQSSFRWNISGHADLGAGFGLGLFVYDLLATPTNANGVRWDHGGNELYTTDLRSFAATLEKTF